MSEKTELQILQKELKQLRKKNDEVMNKLSTLELNPNVIAYKDLLVQMDAISNQISALTNSLIPLQKVRCCEHILVPHYEKENENHIVYTCVRCGLTSKYLGCAENELEFSINSMWKTMEESNMIESYLFCKTPYSIQEVRNAYDIACSTIKNGSRAEITKAMQDNLDHVKKR